MSQRDHFAPAPDRRGNAAVLILFGLMVALGLATLLSRRSEGLRNLSRRSRFSEEAEALALAALEEARVRFAGAANSSGSDAYKLLRSGSPDSGQVQVVAEAAAALAAQGPAWPAVSLDPVTASVVAVRRSASAGGASVPLDWPYGFAFSCRVRLAAHARVDVADRSVAEYYDARLSCVRPPVPFDRVKLWVHTLGTMDAKTLGSVLGRVMIDPGPDPPLKDKVTSFVLHDEPKMAQSFDPLLPQGGNPYSLPLEAISYIVPTAASAISVLYPVEGDPTAMVLPEGIMAVGEDLDLPDMTRFRFHGLILVNGNIGLQGLIREVPQGTDETLVLATLGDNRSIRADERPVEAGLLALGDHCKVEPSSGTSRLQVHGVIASKEPSGILTGVIVYDPLLYNGQANGPYGAPTSPGSPAGPPSPSEADPAAYRFTMAQYPSQTVAEAP